MRVFHPPPEYLTLYEATKELMREMYCPAPLSGTSLTERIRLFRNSDEETRIWHDGHPCQGARQIEI